MGKHLTLSSLQTILPPIKHLIDKKAENIDWNENNPNAKGYVRNRPFYIENENGKVLLDGTFVPDEGAVFIDYFEIIKGEKYIVTFNGVEYSTIGKYFQGDTFSCHYLGNESLGGLTGNDTGEPFFIGLMPGNSAILSDIQEFTITVKSYANKYHKIDPKFLPEVETAMIVKIEDTSTYIARNPKATHTSKEIYEAYMVGRQVYFQYTNESTLIPLIECNEYNAIFIGNVLPGFGSIIIPKDALFYDVAQYAFIIDSEGYVDENPSMIGTFSSQLNDKVSYDRTINGQSLQSNITLTAADVGAATEEYVDNAVANLVDSSPETLNTLNELAAALGEDPNFATTVTNQIANKADKSEVPTNLMNGDGNWSLRMKSANSASGDHSFTMGAFSEASGQAAVASGISTKAIGQASHAEGSNTIAIGSASHSEGSESAAVGAYSHAEGRNIALGESSHAESGSGNIAAALKITGDAGATTYTVNIENPNEYLGYIIRYAVGSEKKFAQIISADTINNTITTSNTLSSTALTDADASIRYGASGVCSHSEGRNSIASGMASHAEGNFTNAYARMSHAEGHGTIAKGNIQHVQGEYNIIDTASKYAHIVGNGESDETRSNAHTLDWSGNAWYQGDVYVGGTSQDDAAAEKLATENYVDNRISEIGGIPILTDSVTGINYELFVENGTLGMKKTDILGGKVRLKDSATDKNYELYVTNGQLSMKEVE